MQRRDKQPSFPHTLTNAVLLYIHLLNTYTIQIFWTKYFGNEVEVSWSTFVSAFEREYGDHPDEAVERFKKVGR